MDKKNTAIGLVLLAAAIASLIYANRYSRRVPTAQEIRQEVARQTPPPSGPPALSAAGSQAAFTVVGRSPAGAAVSELENSYVRVRFTDYGGAILDVALKKYPASVQDRSDPFVFNQLHVDPILAFVDVPGLGRDARFALVAKTGREIVYRASAGGLEVTRRYTLSPDRSKFTDPYLLRCETTFRNLSDRTLPARTVGFALGTAAPVSPIDYGRQLAAGYSNGSSQKFTVRSQFEPSSGFFGSGLGAHEARPAIVDPGPIVWGAVKNQFFSSILTPDRPGIDLVAHRVKLLDLLPDSDPKAYGVTAEVELGLPALKPQGEAALGAGLYVGPNEYHRLANADVFKADQDKVMQFGMFSFFSELLVTLMTWIHHLVPNWGVAIIGTTLLLKFACLPLSMVAARSARRMQKIQPEMQALREKFKDNPQKLQAATLELFRQHKVNPLGGCIPMLLPMPFFFGFFYMLQNTAELRLAPFLWARDLSAPDTVGHFFHLPVNPLPLILGAASLVQTLVMPQPTVDNAQARMMKFTPLFFVVFYYSYSCALSVYSTTNALFTIAQQLVVNRMRDPVEEAASAPRGKAAGGKPAKPAAPGKRRP